jgi:pimeloyl-ACP methyl ester carboxylesterase
MKRKRLLLIPLALLLVLVLGFVAWGSFPARPMPAALTAQEKPSVAQSAGSLIFQPAGQPTTGFIFYPGGRVDYRAYAPLAQSLADAGYLVAIPRMPLNLAVFGIGKAQAVIDAYPEIEHWVIGGHSLGGSMAAAFADENRSAIDGLVFLASYPASSNDLSASGMPVLSIYGEQDGLADPATVEQSRPLLPASATFVEIAGGNHAQFGWYGDQSGDNPAEITREDQQQQVTAAILAFLQTVEEQP